MARILVIDDEALVRYTIREMLESAGHSVVEAENGRAGLGIYEFQNIYLTITDILMPEKDGVQTIQEFKSLRSGGKIIAIAGGSVMRREGRLGLASKMGADNILAKPFSAEELIETVNDCLNA